MTKANRKADPHTHHKPGQPVPVHVEADITVQFVRKSLFIVQTVTFDKPGEVFLDMRGQTVHTVVDGEKNGDENGYLSYDQDGDDESVLGSRLVLSVPESKVVVMSYTTSATAAGLQWLTPQQAGSTYAMLYSQFEAINGRSVFILPDSPGIRFTYAMTLKVPWRLRGLMSADKHAASEVVDDKRVERWEMTSPVPLYLVAINVGDFWYEAYNDRCGVWASPDGLPRAINGLRETARVLKAEEKLFGPYLWGRYRTVVLPQLGYPYGAMEHPCLTSMNAMLMADERAATRVTIHEMVHSWFGNLITNATWNDFWLNEGVTTFGEWLVIKEVYGEEAMRLQIALAQREMQKAFAYFSELGIPEMGCLKTNLAGKNPDDYFSRVPYVKGALFLWAIMQKVGEERMLAFLKDYIKTYRFTSIDTAQFLRFIKRKLGQDVLDSVDANAWVYEPGLPDFTPIESAKEKAVLRYSSKAVLPTVDATHTWTSEEWQLYFSSLNVEVASWPLFTELDKTHNFSTSEKGMLQFAFLRAALDCAQVPNCGIAHQVTPFLMTYGRTVYLVPLYRGLCKRGLVDQAKATFAEARNGYHPVGQAAVEMIFREFEAVAA